MYRALATAHAFRAASRISRSVMPCFRRCARRWLSSAPERHRLNVARSSGRSSETPGCPDDTPGLLPGLLPFSDNARTSGGNKASSAFLYAFQSPERTTTAAKSRSSAHASSRPAASTPMCSTRLWRKMRSAAQCLTSISSVSGALAIASVTLCSAILARRRAERSTADATSEGDPRRGAANSSASPSMPSATRCSYTHRPGARSTTLGEAATIAFVGGRLERICSCATRERLDSAGFHLERGSSGQVLRNSRRQTRLLAVSPACCAAEDARGPVDVPWRATCGELGRFERVRLAGSGRERVWRPRDARFL